MELTNESKKLDPITDKSSDKLPSIKESEISLPEAQINAISALAEATSELARAISKISYTPTQWVDNSEPDINAANLNKIEQGILQATTAINGAVDAINAINGNLGYQNYSGDWNDMPTGIFNATSYNSSHTPLGNDGYTYAVFCKANLFQIAFRVTDTPNTICAFQRYCREGVWQVWMNSFVTNSDFDANNNKYLAMLKQQWKNLPVSSDASKPGYTNIETNGPTVNVLYHKHLTGNYGWAILCSYDHELPKPIYIRLVDGVWQDAFYL